jgi:hypothetical protein
MQPLPHPLPTRRSFLSAILTVHCRLLPPPLLFYSLSSLSILRCTSSILYPSGSIPFCLPLFFPCHLFTFSPSFKIFPHLVSSPNLSTSFHRPFYSLFYPLSYVSLSFPFYPPSQFLFPTFCLLSSPSSPLNVFPSHFYPLFFPPPLYPIHVYPLHIFPSLIFSRCLSSPFLSCPIYPFYPLVYPPPSNQPLLSFSFYLPPGNLPRA